MENSSDFEYLVESGEHRLDQFLARQSGRSRSFIKEQLELGRISVNGAVASKPSQPLRPNDKVTGSWTVAVQTPLVAIAYDLEILFEDSDILIINKPQGVVTHPGAGRSGPTLVNYLMHHLMNHSAFSEFKDTDRPGIVHRLDRGTSGVICVAKNRPALEKISHQFKERQVNKQYEAIVWGKMGPQGRIKSVIGRDNHDRKKISTTTNRGREAITEWKTEKVFSHFSLVRLFPKTGRTHQLRVHLSEAKFPIVGDGTYGGQRHLKKLSLPQPLTTALGALKETFLHAAYLSFLHPTTGETVAFQAPRPQAFDEFVKLVETLDP